MARKNRDEFSEALKKTLRDRVGGICSQPACRTATVGPDIGSDDKPSITGVAAHICAAAPGGPRYDPSQTPNERASLSNAIWLCATCATLIDRNGGKAYSVDKLLSWKRDAEQQAYEALLSNAAYERPVWLDRFSTFHFANVPRLAQLLPTDAMPDWLIEMLKDGFPASGMIAGEISAVAKAIETASIEAIPLEDLHPLSDDAVGAIISFHHNCLTKNGVMKPSEVDERWITEFSPDKSPHFYIKDRGAKIQFPYDPRWVTTTTAYSDFRGGRRKFAGLGIMKHISDDLSEVIVSPLLVGLPRHVGWDLLLR